MAPAPAPSAAQRTSAPMPLSARKADPLDLSTVERRGQPNAAREPLPKANRPHGLHEAPTYKPTLEEFRDPFAYMRRIGPTASKYGIVKIIPPEEWNPPFSIDTELFHFRTRRQELNSVEGSARVKQNYLEGLKKFHRQRGANLTRLPSVDKRPLDLDELRKAVETRGGFEAVCKGKKWAEIGRDLGYSGKIMSSLSTSLKNSYQKFCQPYEDYLKVAKPGVYMQLEMEKGGPFTPSPGASPMKQSSSQQATPNSLPTDSPAIRASTTLNAQLQQDGKPPSTDAKPTAGGFTAVNAGGGFTAVNAAPTSAASSFTAANPPNPSGASGAPSVSNAPSAANATNGGAATGQSTPARSANSPMPSLSARPTPDFRSELPPGVMTNGQFAANQLKRQLSNDQENGDDNGRRSKRLKKDHLPTVTGSQMTQPRTSTPRPRPQLQKENSNQEKIADKCDSCGKSDDPSSLLICDSCDNAYHKQCIESPLPSKSGHDWHCHKCLVGTGEFGFEDGEVYSLKQFQEKANRFREDYFKPKMPFDPILNTKRQVSEDDVEREFWRLVENLNENIEVEYGADIHSTTHGSGFPTVEKCPQDAYSSDPWNLNRLPLYGESLFRHIKSDVSGMTVPWLYVGMCFSTFCWHNEDHYAYSANYQHFGATKTWYGIPGEDAEKFENAMRAAVPELFEREPDLLFQLVTLLPPEQLKKAGVRVYALDQRAGQFVVTYPQAYHAGFNHGFNFNEAVNFAPPDWESFGAAGIQRLQDFRRQPCFSHEEMLLTAASRDHTIKSARWLAPALERLLEKELATRKSFLDRHQEAGCHQPSRCGLREPRLFSGTKEDEEQRDPMCQNPLEISDRDLSEDDYVCSYCKAYSYLSRFVCLKSGKVLCLLHAGSHPCCDEVGRYTRSHKVSFRMDDETLSATVQKVVEKARAPEAWAEKVDKLLEDEPTPSLKSLRSLVSEGEKIPWELPRLSELKKYVERCNEWVEEAMNYITRKQQNRRKNDRLWRRGSTRTAELEEKEKELRNVDNIRKLLSSADKLSFDCPEITTLRERADKIADFQRDAQTVLRNPNMKTVQELDELVELGKSYSVDIPEVDSLDKLVQQMKWFEEAKARTNQTQSLKDLADFLQQARDLKIPEQDPFIVNFNAEKHKGELWEMKAKEVMAAENVHYQQLDALSKQASTIPVSPETLAQVDAILKKQRDARDHIQNLYERSQLPEFRKRPKYKEVRDAMEALSELNSKPAGTLDLEREQKKHEDWMRRGKKLFGKANAPLHILLSHMQIVEQRNQACLELRDTPRVPVEPASRQATPDSNAPMKFLEGNPGGYPDVFCICRRPEAGMMIECEMCHEWYHGKCLKIARGKVKDEDKYTCPICDWRVKIPRDAARPKLEDLMGWQDEILTLPFQPEEEDCLANIINHALEFRQFVAPFINPIQSNPDELSNQRFYLRKVEGADILLAPETNFLRQEVHKWAPVAPEPPPVLQVSLSTRKPRPTKQQKLMAQYGVDNPDDLPAHLRTRTHFRNRKSIGGEGGIDGPSSKQGGRPTSSNGRSNQDNRSHTPPGYPRNTPPGYPRMSIPTGPPSAGLTPNSAGLNSFGYPEPNHGIYATSPLFSQGSGPAQNDQRRESYPRATPPVTASAAYNPSATTASGPSASASPRESTLGPAPNSSAVDPSITSVAPAFADAAPPVASMFDEFTRADEPEVEDVKESASEKKTDEDKEKEDVKMADAGSTDGA